MRKIKEEIDALQAEIRAHRNLSGTEQLQLEQYYLVGLTYASNALSGSALTLAETQRLLEDELTPAGKPVKDTLAALGHRDACKYMFSLAGEDMVTEEQVRAIHHRLVRLTSPEAAGCYRQQKIFISGSVYPAAAPEKIPALMANLLRHLQRERAEMHPVTFAAKLHKKFMYIHPFSSGNARTARLLMNLSLLQAGFPPLVLPPSCRAEYMAKLEKAHKTPYVFAEFIAGQVLRAQQDYLRLLK